MLDAWEARRRSFDGEARNPMHYQHHRHPSSVDDHPGADHRLEEIQARLRRIATLSAWAEHWANKVTALEGALTHAETELEDMRQELSFWRRNRAQAAAQDSGEMPPPHYLAAVRTPQTEEYRTVAVDIDGEEWIVGLRRDRPTGFNPVQELNDWHKLVAAVREVRAQMREEM
ncbi:hypothetical protein ACGF0J_21640 [Nonomuraea sp. NPDC047897]|uniref:hypothetical protein n=1 Tax=Nonomuraea sp. NPDC047897 TaxID=3364346 RepID=UPI0037151DE7